MSIGSGVWNDDWYLALDEQSGVDAIRRCPTIVGDVESMAVSRHGTEHQCAADKFSYIDKVEPEAAVSKIDDPIESRLTSFRSDRTPDCIIGHTSPRLEVFPRKSPN